MVGRNRNPWVVILLSIVTLGIYLLYWIYITFAEVRAHRGVGVSGIVGLLLALIPVSIFLLPQYVGNMYGDKGKDRPVSGMTGIWALVPLVGGIVWLIKTQGALNSYWDMAQGDEAPAAAAAAPEAAESTPAESAPAEEA